MTTVIADSDLEPPPATEAAGTARAQERADGHNRPVGQLRGFVVLLVVIFHAVLAYYPRPLPFTEPVRRFCIPVLDTGHFDGARVFAVFNDIYFMSLMFFISGLFVWPSLKRKGASAFLAGRTLRLGAPFLVSAFLVAGLAYLPSYLQAEPGGDLAGYFSAWQTPARWMCGPAWFVAYLLLLDASAAGCFVALPRLGGSAGRLAAGAARRPLRLVAVAAGLTACAYVPLALALGPYSWQNLGPFWLQGSRALSYAAWFWLGVSLGISRADTGLTGKDGALSRRWWAWALAALAAFDLAGNLMRSSLRAHATQTLLYGGATDLAWSVSCALTCFAMLAAFARFSRPSRLFDSLSRNAYAIYLLHYPFVTWSQYLLLRVDLPAPAKALAVILAAAAGGWSLAAGLRRIPAVARLV